MQFNRLFFFFAIVDDHRSDCTAQLKFQCIVGKKASKKRSHVLHFTSCCFLGLPLFLIDPAGDALVSGASLVGKNMVCACRCGFSSGVFAHTQRCITPSLASAQFYWYYVLARLRAHPPVDCVPCPAAALP